MRRVRRGPGDSPGAVSAWSRRLSPTNSGGMVFVECLMSESY